MSTDKFDLVLARADRVMRQIDERQGASRSASQRERQRLMSGYGRALSRATIGSGAIIGGALLFGLFVMPLQIIGFMIAVAIAIAAFMLLFFGGAAKTATAPNIPADLPNAEMIDRFDSFMFRARRALPAPAQAQIDLLGQRLQPLRETLSRVPDSDPEAQDARRLMSTHLPGLVERYLHVPTAFRTESDAEGKTVDDRLVDALAAGRTALDDISAKLARKDLAAFETQGRFIESRYKDEQL
jgi:hypothetical protein